MSRQLKTIWMRICENDIKQNNKIIMTILTKMLNDYKNWRKKKCVIAKKNHFFFYIFIIINWPSKFKNNYRDQKLSKIVCLFKDRKSDNIY